MSQDLWMIFKSKDSQSIMTAACQSMYGGDRPLTTATRTVANDNDTPAKTELGVSATAFKNCLWVGYVRPDSGTLCLARSRNGGQSFDVDMDLGTRFESEDPPALAVFNDRLWIFWRSKALGKLHCSSMDGIEPSGLTAPQQMQDHESQATATMLYAPAAVAFQGALWVAYVGKQGQDIFFARSTDGGASFQLGIFLSLNGKDISSKTAPALAVWNDRLWMFWRSRSDESIYYSSIGSWSIEEFTAPKRLVGGDGTVAVTRNAPAAAVFNGELCVAYTDTWQGDIKFARFLDNGNSVWVGVYMGREDISSNRAPALFADVGISGSIRPKYQLLSILYSPPGAIPEQPSYVQYWNGSSAGSTVSIARSADDSFKVTAKVEAEGNSVEAGFEQKVSSSNSRDLTVTKTESTKWTLMPKVQADGIDHGNDVLMIVINPVIKATSGAIGNLAWSLGSDEKSSLANLVLKWIYPTVDTTNNKVKELMSDFGFTEEDFQKLAQCHPCCASTTIDTERFQVVSKVPYQANTDMTSEYELGTQKSRSYSSSSTSSLTVSCSLSSGFAVAGFSAEVTTSSEFKWETSSSNTQSTDVSQTAIAFIGNPSEDLPGKPVVYIYLDKIYNTFMFSFDLNPFVSAESVPFAASVKL